MSTTSIYTSNKSQSLSDFIENFYRIVENAKRAHENDIECLNKKIKELENENKKLRTIHQQHPHSIFDINYVPNQSADIEQLQTELTRAQKQIETLQTTLNQQYSEYEDMRSKYSLQRLMNENYEQQNSTIDSNRLKELELKFKQIREQISQFDQCNYETEEQIRLLKQIISDNDSDQLEAITKSITVKQSDLTQQNNIVEKLLQKQNDEILKKVAEILNTKQVSQPQEQIQTNKSKKTKRKRL